MTPKKPAPDTALFGLDAGVFHLGPFHELGLTDGLIDLLRKTITDSPAPSPVNRKPRHP